MLELGALAAPWLGHGHWHGDGSPFGLRCRRLHTRKRQERIKNKNEKQKARKNRVLLELGAGDCSPCKHIESSKHRHGRAEKIVKKLLVKLDVVLSGNR